MATTNLSTAGHPNEANVDLLIEAGRRQYAKWAEFAPCDHEERTRLMLDHFKKDA